MKILLKIVTIVSLISIYGPCWADIYKYEDEKGWFILRIVQEILNLSSTFRIKQIRERDTDTSAEITPLLSIIITTP